MYLPGDLLNIVRGRYRPEEADLSFPGDIRAIAKAYTDRRQWHFSF